MVPADPDLPGPDPSPESATPSDAAPRHRPGRRGPGAMPTPEPVARTTRRRLPVLPISIAVVAILAGSALFMSGYTLGRQAASAPRDAGLGQRARSSRSGTPTTRSTTGTPAARSIGTRSIQGAIRGMIDSLDDPYSAYLTSDEYRQSLQGISGQFEGIGAEIAAAGDRRHRGLHAARTGLPPRGHQADRGLARRRRPGS